MIRVQTSGRPRLKFILGFIQEDKTIGNLYSSVKTDLYMNIPKYKQNISQSFICSNT